MQEKLLNMSLLLLSNTNIMKNYVVLINALCQAKNHTQAVVMFELTTPMKCTKQQAKCISAGTSII